eukprot:COSAG01_NODE_8657_length_2706_cov_1.345608_4_plen_45_part_01
MAVSAWEHLPSLKAGSQTRRQAVHIVAFPAHSRRFLDHVKRNSDV